MASLLMQERLLGFSLGAALDVGLASQLHRSYWKSTADLAHEISHGRIAPPNPVPRLTFCKNGRFSLSHFTLHEGHGPSRIVCMAHPRRVQMVAQQIKREIGDMLIKDKVLQHAILPETALGADMYLSSLATVSDVVLSKDLQVAKVYISVCSDERGKEIVMEGLKAKTKHVRAGLGKRMQLRLTPEVRFIMDDSLERGSRVLAILDRLQKEREQREAGRGGVDANDDDVDDDDNWEDIEEDGKSLTTLPNIVNKNE